MQADGSRQECYLHGHCFFFESSDKRLVPGSILHSGDSLDGSAFFMGQDDSTWSWGQGTGKNLASSLSFVTATVTVYSKSSHGSECSCVVGINAGVMLLQPNQWVFNDMLAELSEPNHPEHCVGNGPEQET